MEMGRSVSDTELAREMGMSLQEFYALTNEIRGLEVSSLQCESGDEGQEADLAQNLPGPPDEDPLTLFVEGEQKELLQRAIGKLPERVQQVPMLYYQQELTMKEVGELMGVGESRVSQIHTQAVKHLRAVI